MKEDGTYRPIDGKENADAFIRPIANVTGNADKILTPLMQVSAAIPTLGIGVGGAAVPAAKAASPLIIEGGSAVASHILRNSYTYYKAGELIFKDLCDPSSPSVSTYLTETQPGGVLTP